MRKIALIGAGKMGTAIAKGLVDNGAGSGDVLAVDISPEAQNAYSEATGLKCHNSPEDVVPLADALICAVKPQVAGDVLPQVGKSGKGKLVISIMAGVKIARLTEWFPGARVIRIMPNTPLMVGQGACAFAVGAGVTEDDRQTVIQVFGPLGIVCEVEENKLDAVTALSGSGPAYIFEMIQAMVDGAVELGLSPQQALELTVQTVAGAAEMVARGMGSPDELRDAVTSPGGTTAAGLAVLRKNGFRKTVSDVLRAARDRSVELGS